MTLDATSPAIGLERHWTAVYTTIRMMRKPIEEATDGDMTNPGLVV
jgi:hypothetical protein